MEIKAMYEQLGISRAVYEYGERVLRDLRPALTLLTRWQRIQPRQGHRCHAEKSGKRHSLCRYHWLRL